MPKLLADALDAALSFHGGQLRKGKPIPYVAHLLGVASLVLEHGGSTEQAAAGLLHDALEDTDATVADLAAFGTVVTTIVLDCTDVDEPTEDRGPSTSWTRKQRAIEHVETMPAASVLVSACDKLHNLRDMVADAESGAFATSWPFNVSPEQQVAYYRGLAGALRANAGVPRRLCDEVDALVARLATCLTDRAC